MRFDRKKFFDGTRQWLGSLTQQQVGGLTYILDSMERDPFLTRIEWAAYMLATVYRETAATFQPIHEYGSHNYFVQRYGSQTAVGKRLGNDTPEEGAIYAGRGDVQLTGETNYEKSEAALRNEYPEIVADFERRTGKTFDLTVGDQPNDQDDPNNAQDPAIAYAIMSFGMRTGLFTGLKLSDYTKVAGFDALNARRIINGTDHAAEIAAAYGRILSILTAAKVATNTFADLENGDFLDIPNSVPPPVVNEPISSSPEPASVNEPIPPTSETAPKPVNVAEQDPKTTKLEQTVTASSTGEQTQSETVTTSTNVAIEKDEHIGFFQGIWKQLTGWVSAIGGLSALQGYKQQLDDLHLPGQIVVYVLIAALVAFVGWFVYQVSMHFWHLISRRLLTTALVQANSTTTNQVVVAKTEDLDALEKLGWKVVRRG